MRGRSANWIVLNKDALMSPPQDLLQRAEYLIERAIDDDPKLHDFNTVDELATALIQRQVDFGRIAEHVWGVD